MVKTNFLLGCVVLWLFYFLHPFPTFGKEREQVNPEKIFQQISEKTRWTLMGEAQRITGRDLLEVGQDIGEFVPEFRIDKAYQARFLHKKDSCMVTTTIFEAPSQIMAFGFYSVQKSPSLEFYDYGFESYLSGERLFSWYGKYVVLSEMADTLQDNEKYLKDIVRQIVRRLPKQKRHTPILDALPEKNKVEHSEKFYVHRWLDQNYFENIYYADYYANEEYSRIFIIDNGTTATADSNFWRYYSFMKKKSRIVNDTLNIATDYFVVDEPLWGKTLLAKKNRIIYGILNYRKKDWTEDRMQDVLNRLKKRKVVKSG